MENSDHILQSQSRYGGRDIDIDQNLYHFECGLTFIDGKQSSAMLKTHENYMRFFRATSCVTVMTQEGY